MLILGINTALANAEIAVTKNNKTIASTKDDNAFSQATSISRLIKQAMDSAKISFKDVDLIACTTGPGSFTGIRIGLAAAKGLEIALNKPVIGVNIFEAAALNYPDKNIIVLVDSRRGDFFAQEFEHNTPVNAPFVVAKEATSDQISGYIFADNELMLAENACLIALSKHKNNISSPAVPLYIRPADVTICKK